MSGSSAATMRGLCITLRWLISAPLGLPVVPPVYCRTATSSLLISGLVSFCPEPFLNAKKWGPLYVFLVGWIVSLVTLFKGLKHLHLDFSPLTSFFISIGFGLLMAYIGKRMIDRIEVDESADREFAYASVERAFAPMMIFTACAMAFAHGSNDVANAVGTSVGAGALTVGQAVMIAIVFEFAGAYLAGGEVTATVRKGIVDASVFSAHISALIAHPFEHIG